MATAFSLPRLAAVGRMVVRVGAIALGTYAASSAIVAACVAVLIVVGANRSDAFIVCSLAGFALYVVVALWAATVRRLPVLVGWLVLATAAGAAITLLLAGHSHVNALFLLLPSFAGEVSASARTEGS